MRWNKYIALIRSFLGHELPVLAFEQQYLAAFKAEPGGMPPEVYRILETLFEAVDCYDPDVRPGQETAFAISEQQLRREAAQALEHLELLSQEE